MDSKTMEGYREKLEKKKENAVNILKQFDRNEINDAQPEYIKELSVYDNHPGDIGSETYEMEKTYALKGQEIHRIQEIGQALDRIEQGVYGICALCGKEISAERLEAYPEADVCLDCSRGTRIPGERVREGRPVEEETLNYPYNRDGNRHHSTIFDGEDSWQAVARYNRREDDPSNQTGDDQGIWDELPSGLVEDIDSISSRYYKGTLSEDNEE